MRGGIRILGILSVILLICVLIGQGTWLIKIKEVKINEFRQVSSFILSKVIDECISAMSIDPVYDFTCGVKSDKETFVWEKGNKKAKICAPQEFYEMMKLVFYDHLYQRHFSYLEKIDSLYRKKLLEVGISARPVLMVWDSTGQTLMTTDSLFSFKGRIFSKPLNVGYECKHQIVAAFPAEQKCM